MSANDDTSPGDPRVFLAIERTFLAWTRTAVALMGFGFVVARLGLFLRELSGPSGGAGSVQAASPSVSLLLGTVMVVIGIVVQGLSWAQHRRHVSKFRRGESLVPGEWSLSDGVGFAMIAVGIIVAVYLVALLR